MEKVASDIEKLLAKKRNALNASIRVLFFYFYFGKGNDQTHNVVCD